MMSIEPISLVAALTIGLAIGALVGWLLCRPVIVRLQTDLERDRLVNAERLQAHDRIDAKLRETFQALSAEALHTNNRAFLDLAESRLREARTEATADPDASTHGVEQLLAPLAKTLEQVDREIKESERHRVETTATLIQRIAALDT